MIVVALTDIHGRTERLADVAGDLAAADVVLLTGDLTNFGREREAAEVVDAVRAHNDTVLAVTGNCDYPEVGDYLTAEGIGLHGGHRVIDGVAFVGLGGSLPCPGWTPNELTDGQLKRRLRDAVGDLDAELPWVLVSHQPPAGTSLDRVRSGDHVGSRSVRDFIEGFEPLVCFSGHIHEGAGTDAIGPTRLINPGPLHMGHCAHAEISDGELKALETR